MKKIIASPLAPKAVGPYSQAVESNGTLYVSGQLPINAATGAMAEGIEEQTRQSLTNIRYIVEEAGYTLADVTKVTVLLDDIADFRYEWRLRYILYRADARTRMLRGGKVAYGCQG